MPEYKEDKIGVSDLLFDPNNYRFQETKDFVYANPERFHEEGVQERAYKTLKNTAKLSQLKASILRNGFVPVERIVVTPYEPKPGQFITIEGILPVFLNGATHCEQLDALGEKWSGWNGWANAGRVPGRPSDRNERGRFR